MSLKIVVFTFVFAFKREGLNSLPSVRVCRYILSSTVPKACLRSSKKKITKTVGANMQPCLTPLRILKGLDTFPSCCTVPPHTVMKRLNKTFQFRWASYLGKHFEQTVSTYHIKSFYEINE